jgi:hypothetical protein
VITLADLKARCIVDAITHCWIWQGGKTRGKPSIYTIDYAKQTKCVMSGPRAAWQIAHECAPSRGAKVYRTCTNELCVNPAHLRQLFGGQKAMAAHLAATGTLKGQGRFTPGRQAALLKARAVRNRDVPDSVVLAIRAAPASVSALALAGIHGVHHSTAARIRNGETRTNVVAA